MAVTQLEDPFATSLSQLSINVPVYNPIHSVHQSPLPAAIQNAPPKSNTLILEHISEDTYLLELRLDIPTAQCIVYQRRKFVSEVRQLLNSIPTFTELNVSVSSNGMKQPCTRRLRVVDLFWTTITSNILETRHSLMKLCAWNDGYGWMSAKDSDGSWNMMSYMCAGDGECTGYHSYGLTCCSVLTVSGFDSLEAIMKA
jgi:hypothetical protein